ncbi:MAG: GNAT family N-acetyltransferase [Candidatus Cloacimonetes bacterium]|nr:GNAT family N-acetyltransferase [Candidatus Cloacimonadota bacterium]
MQILETKRLVLKLHTLDNLDLLYPILSDPQTMQYYPRPYTKDEVQGWIERSITGYQKRNYGLWAVFLKEQDKFIGQCGISLQNIDGELVPEIGYHIHKDFWRLGYASEAAKACLDYGFNKLHLPEIYIHTWIKNIPSYKIAEKLNMLKIKEYDKVISSADCVMRHVVYKAIQK